jgi:hypothetical protein
MKTAAAVGNMVCDGCAAEATAILGMADCANDDRVAAVVNYGAAEAGTGAPCVSTEDATRDLPKSFGWGIAVDWPELEAAGAIRTPPPRNRKFADSPLEGDGFEPSVPRLGDLSYHAGSRLRDEIVGPENDRCAVGRAFGSAIPGGTVNSFGRQRANCVIDPPSFASLGASSKVASIAPSNTQAAPASPPARAVSQIHDRNGCCRSFDRCSRLS